MTALTNKKECKKYEAMMDAYVCETLTQTERSELEIHTTGCTACTHTFSEIKEAFSLIEADAEDEQAVPTPDWDTQWRIIRKRVFETTAPRNQTARGFGWRLAALTAAGAMVIFILGIFVGKYMIFSPSKTGVSGAQISSQLQAALQDHIESIEPVIIQYANYRKSGSGNENLSIDIDREMAAKFLVKNRLLQGKLLTNKNQYMRQLLEELDMILTEISNLTTDEPENLLLIKELIKIKGILLKVEVFHAGVKI
ncbi:MAG: hypothetical protein GY950_12155 [bacterium]|nr:hypothetical protein [bacterium]